MPRLSLARVIMLLAVLAVGYYLFAAAKDTLLTHHLTQEEQQLRDGIARLQRQQSELKAIRDFLNTDEYVQGAARKLGLVKPGETLVIVSSTAPGEPTPTPKPGGGQETWWEQLFSP